MNEPSVWDYLKALLTPWRGPAPVIPPLPEHHQTEEKAGEHGGSQARSQHEEADQELVLPARAIRSNGGESIQVEESISPDPVLIVLEKTAVEQEVASGVAETAKPAATPASFPVKRKIPWLSLGALLLALAAQRSFEPDPARTWQTGTFLYVLAFAWAAAASWKLEWSPAMLKPQETRQEMLTVRLPWFLAGTLLAFAAFWVFGGTSFEDHRFNWGNLLLLFSALFFMIKAFWVSEPQEGSWLKRLDQTFHQRNWSFMFSSWTLLALAAAVVVIFFRVYNLEQVPPEMVSDHAEKLLDVGEVLNGNTWTYFPRNTGREALQMYLTAAVASLFGTGLSFLSLKIGTAAAGLLMLPFIYLLGKEVGNRRVGLLAALLAGIAYWPNVISRVALRFTLYPLFVAPALYFLIRGLRRSNRNDFILSGVFLGIGLHGYTPIRFLPVLIVVGVLLFLLHQQSRENRKSAIFNLVVLALISLVIFIPLLRVAVDMPDNFLFRVISRAGTAERPLPGSAVGIFLSNLWRAMTMYAWDDGDIWVTSVTHRPALDIVSGALFYLGMVLLLLRYIRRRHWLDLFLLLAVPLLMMPSILSLAFPGENPSLNRASGALVVVFLIAALAFDGLLTAIQARMSGMLGKTLAVSLSALLLLWSGVQNYNLVFRQYQVAYALSSWNTSEIGEIIGNYANSVGSPQSAWVVAVPHWVDTRLVGINAGYPNRDYAIFPNELNKSLAVTAPKLFIVNIADQVSLDNLAEMYPQGWLKEYESEYEGKNFFLYFVPFSEDEPAVEGSN
ncbi:MAG: hypothetical protein EHM41_12760 [Chloroflexi bacterium]|nr:MAG: hypothetical protein EHM41_12760 [Chloroflexota bacterium]